MSETYSINQEFCNQCGGCIPECESECISDSGTNIEINTDCCTGCRVCYYFCPLSAIYQNP